MKEDRRIYVLNMSGSDTNLVRDNRIAVRVGVRASARGKRVCARIHAVYIPARIVYVAGDGRWPIWPRDPRGAHSLLGSPRGRAGSAPIASRGNLSQSLGGMSPLLEFGAQTLGNDSARLRERKNCRPAATAARCLASSEFELSGGHMAGRAVRILSPCIPRRKGGPSRIQPR
jgi:hypothetical protein